MRTKKIEIIACMILIVAFLSYCTKSDTAGNTDQFSALPLTVANPAGNTQTTEKIALGKLLFWDPVLSGGKDVACGSCHHSSSGFSDNLDLAIGVNGTGTGAARHFIFPNSIPFSKRNTPTILNTAFNGINTAGTNIPDNAPMFFDIRTRSLELQSLEPIKTMEEMRGTSIGPSNILDSVVRRIRNIPGYISLFGTAFSLEDTVSAGNIGKAIACYERTLVSNHSPFDEYMRGNKQALTSAQLNGMTAFQSNGCLGCHNGPMLSDYALHLLSVPDNSKLHTDAGSNGTYAFRTPGLRNLSLTAPYMHSGVFGTLREVLDFYERIGDGQSQNPHVAGNRLDGNLKRINNRDKDNIIQFLRSLDDAGFDKSIPATVPNGLQPGGK